VILRLLLLFIVVPFIELAILLKLAEVTSVPHTLMLVIITGAIGTWLARSQGIRTLQRIREAMGRQEMPTDPLIDAVMILIAGALLLTPGILTDAFGFSLLIPFFRKWYRIGMVHWFKTRFQIQTSFGEAAAEPQKTEIIESYVIEHDEKDSPSTDR
jgi:UPF0716 protein FxsA